ncbi:hypothetical protein E3P81_04013 [Wallemia ichthyophaga]|nr:hypothetical protein E3P98_03696 [Wallemia ichthyophaga]TIA87231.1 hypothetical protein E3P97_04022 [Wallemia ichthyophaga]TIA95726.1 hypothetical protein E3P96_03773 [Wallemia ichthyophaga]TIB27864.1 hypothetical protein E3P85_04006 [Wallemia ichthyophaga]TIB43411.1 hypothetical protein E3P82_04026 [Wallemia ichthyophaga]
MKLSVIAATIALLSTAFAAPLLDHVANGAADKILKRGTVSVDKSGVFSILLSLLKEEKRLLNDVANGALDKAI